MGVQRLELDDLAAALLVVKEVSNGSEKYRCALDLPIGTGKLHPSLLYQILRILVMSGDRKRVAVACLHQLSIAHRLLGLWLFFGHGLGTGLIVRHRNRYCAHFQIPFVLFIQSERRLGIYDTKWIRGGPLSHSVRGKRVLPRIDCSKDFEK